MSEPASLEARLARAERILQALKYYGDGLRWFNRRGGYKGDAAPVVTLLEQYEAQFGQVPEMDNDEYMALVRLSQAAAPQTGQGRWQSQINPNDKQEDGK